MSAIFQCANDNIGALTRNSWQLNLSEHSNFKHNSNKLYWKWNTVHKCHSFRVNYVNDNKFWHLLTTVVQYTLRFRFFINKKSLTIMVCVICFCLLCIWGQDPGLIFGGAYYRRIFLRFEFGGLILGGAYFWNFMVYLLYIRYRHGRS